MPRSAPYLIAGHCTACHVPLWRTATAQKECNGTPAGEVFLLWPAPDSWYVRERIAQGVVPGIAYCTTCLPDLGGVGPHGGTVIAYDSAHERYAAWYIEEKRIFWQVWLRDHLFLEPADVEALMTQWEQDRPSHD